MSHQGRFSLPAPYLSYTQLLTCLFLLLGLFFSIARMAPFDSSISQTLFLTSIPWPSETSIFASRISSFRPWTPIICTDAKNAFRLLSTPLYSSIPMDFKIPYGNYFPGSCSFLAALNRAVFPIYFISGAVCSSMVSV